MMKRLRSPFHPPPPVLKCLATVVWPKGLHAHGLHEHGFMHMAHEHEHKQLAALDFFTPPLPLLLSLFRPPVHVRALPASDLH